ncbi:MAG: efflux RND transporter periplasmic adaptor subunit [Clostridia bacterium]|nr:efflux RND transporter periplasmic adaptor subunit [Deltaproteobacteria bacterium]
MRNSIVRGAIGATQSFFVLIASIIVLLLSVHFLAGCSPGRANAANDAPLAPTVTTALPVVADAIAWDEYTGHTEAVASVEIRARVSGYLERVGFSEGAIVRKGELLYALDARPYEAEVARADAEVTRAKANLELAERDVTRADKLVAERAISPREADVNHTNAAQQRAAVQSAEASLKAARLNIEYSYLNAPITGRVGRTAVTPGNLIAAGGEPLTTIVSVDPLYVYVDVDESRALVLANGPQKGSNLQSEKRHAQIGLGEEADYPREAAIDWIDNRADAATGTIRVRAVVPNPDGLLRPGMFARMRVPSQTLKGALLVDDRAIGTDQDRKFVYIVESNGTVVYRAVKLGPKHDGLRIVLDGITKDDRVIVSGLQRVRPGVMVRANTIADSTK